MSIKEQSRGVGVSHVGGNKIICFDVDGTLRDYSDEPRLEVIEVLRRFVNAGWRVVVWSGGGSNYAWSIGRRLGLPESVEYTSKVGGVFVGNEKVKPDIAVDDEHVNLGVRNVFVGKKKVW